MSLYETTTAISVPCIFSKLNKYGDEKRMTTAQQNVIDIIHLAALMFYG
ncbi:hypothetical protein [Colwellia sp. MB02u-14]|nr:hypothetical protein [Colwellia sp. MB02u-14]